MIESSLALVAALNAVQADRVTVPEAEELVVADGLVHHGVQVDPVWPSADESLTLRLLLNRLARQAPRAEDAPPQDRGWGLVLVRPGSMGVLRGPRELGERVLAAATDVCPVVVLRAGGVAVFPLPLGGPDAPEAVQWLVATANRPVFDRPPADAARELTAGMAGAAQELAGLEQVSGLRPARTMTVRLGPAYPAANQQLLDRAMVVLEAAQAGLGEDERIIDSHSIGVRERALLRLRETAWDAVSAAASWPSVTLH